MLRISSYGAGLAAGVFGCCLAMPAGAGIPGGVAFAFVATVTPAADSLSVPDPRSPDECVRGAAAGGDYDVWYFLFSREPLAGAWTVDIGLGFDHRPGHGVDILDWRLLSGVGRASPGWPGEGTGIRIEWPRPDCFDTTHADLFRGEDGWYRQPALRLRVRVHGADALNLADPEPGVPAQVISCYDDAFRLDGEDGWTSYRGPVFGGGEAVGAAVGLPGPDGPGAVSPTLPVTWSTLKSRAVADSLPRGRRP
jgi:hypothetical protein